MTSPAAPPRLRRPAPPLNLDTLLLPLTLAALYLCWCVPGHALSLPLPAALAPLSLARPAFFAGALKMAPILALAAQVAQSARAATARRDTGAARYASLLCGGLLVSSLGDALLDAHGLRREGWWGLRNEHLFTAGLAAFLCAHVLYTVALAGRAGAGSAGAALAAATAFCGSLAMLWEGTPAALRGPVVVYTAAISAMGYAAATAAPHRGNVAATRSALVGALLFMTSDAVLGLQEFGPPSARAALAQQGKLLIMLLYFSAQAALASSAMDEGAAAAPAKRGRLAVSSPKVQARALSRGKPRSSRAATPTSRASGRKQSLKPGARHKEA